MSGTVKIRGMREVEAGLRRARPELKAQLAQAHKAIGEDLIAAPARRLAERLGGGQARLARRQVISASSLQRTVAVRMNAGRVPDAFGQEFGAKRFPQFQPWRGNQWNPDADSGPGYVLHPTILKNRRQVVDKYGDLVMNAMAQAFPERIR